jgi:ATP:corrinoid adenosyltransferase
MTETPPPEENLGDEFRDLGKNLVKILQNAWDRPERRMLQQELESGLSEMADTIKREAKSAAESPTGQRIRSDLDDLGEKVRSGQVETKVREELLGALKTVNIELDKVASHLASSPAAKPEPPTSPPDAPSEGLSPEDSSVDNPGTGE